LQTVGAAVIDALPFADPPPAEERRRLVAELVETSLDVAARGRALMTQLNTANGGPNAAP
jgi:hypothetical protein